MSILRSKTRCYNHSRSGETHKQSNNSTQRGSKLVTTTQSTWSHSPGHSPKHTDQHTRVPSDQRLQLVDLPRARPMATARVKRSGATVLLPGWQQLRPAGPCQWRSRCCKHGRRGCAQDCIRRCTCECKCCKYGRRGRADCAGDGPRQWCLCCGISTRKHSGGR